LAELFEDYRISRRGRHSVSSSISGMVAICFLYCNTILAQQQRSSSDLSCITSLELPTHGFLAARAPNSGIVHASVEIGPEGRLSKVQLTTDSSMSEGLEGEVRVALGDSHFAQRCVGRTLRFVLSFKLEDPPTDSILPPTVRFVPPNRFDLVFRRLKSNLDPASQPKPPR
jgi:hypothetical protein